MGLIRKTASVSTFGIVKFRSPKEKVRRAERAQRAAEKAISQLDSARTHAEKRLTQARQEVVRATQRFEGTRRGRKKSVAEPVEASSASS